MIINEKTNHSKKCYLCGDTEFNVRSGSVRDRSERAVVREGRYVN